MAKRTAIIVVSITVLLLLVAPFAIGMMTENGVRQHLGVYTQNPAYTTNVESYDRRWFDSRAELSLELSENYLDQLGLPDQDPTTQMLRNLSLPIIVEISHGPVLLNDGFALGGAGIKAYVDPESQLGVLASQFLGMPYLFEMRGRSGFGTGFRFQGEIPPFANAMGETGFEFSGFDFTGVMRNGDTQLSGLLQSASFQSAVESLLLEGVAFEMDYDYRDGQLPLSNAELMIGQITASNPLLGAQPLFSLEDFAVGGTMTENAESTHLDMQIFYRLAELQAIGLFEISDFDLSIDLNHLDAEAAAELYELYSQQISATPIEQDLTTLMAPLERLLQGEPTVTIDPLHFSMSGGELTATANLALDSSALPTGQLTDYMDPAVLEQSLLLDLDISASKTLISYLGGLFMEQQLAFATGPDGEPLPPEQVMAMATAQLDLMITGLTAQGLLVDDGDSYSTVIQISNGAATANGQLVPLGAF